LGEVVSRTLFLVLTTTFSGFVGVVEDGGSSFTGDSLDFAGALGVAAGAIPTKQTVEERYLMEWRWIGSMVAWEDSMWSKLI